MHIDIYQVDVFVEKLSQGNPAAVWEYMLGLQTSYFKILLRQIICLRRLFYRLSAQVTIMLVHPIL